MNTKILTRRRHAHSGLYVGYKKFASQYFHCRL